MNNPDHDIEKLLTALRDVEAPPEIERRILQTIRERSQAHAASRWNWISSLLSARPVAPPRWILAIAVAGTAAACLAVFALHRVAQVPPAHPLPPVTAVIPPLTTTPKVAINISQSKSASNTKIHPRRPQPLSATDALALAEMNAPSHPAPPMPLSEQERLLLRIAHRGDPEELAALNPEIRAKLEAKDAADFHNFFEPARHQPKPGDNE